MVLALSLVAGPALGEKRPKPYSIGPGDVLSVVIFAGGQNQEALDLTVASDGTVNFPFLGKVRVADLAVEELTESVTQALAQDYFVNPQVMVNIKEYRSRKISVSGAVGKPGLYVLDSGSTSLLEVIAMAGGVTRDRGSFAYVLRGAADEIQGAENVGELMRQKQTIQVDLRDLLDQGVTDKNVEILAGDVVYLPPTNFSDLTQYKVYVLGKVERPGAYDFYDGLTALDACVLAGGFAKYAAPNRTTITRRGRDSSQEAIEINLEKVRAGKETDIPLKPGDRIYVPESWL